MLEPVSAEWLEIKSSDFPAQHIYDGAGNIWTSACIWQEIAESLAWTPIGRNVPQCVFMVDKVLVKGTVNLHTCIKKMRAHTHTHTHRDTHTYSFHLVVLWRSNAPHKVLSHEYGGEFYHRFPSALWAWFPSDAHMHSTFSHQHCSITIIQLWSVAN